MRDGKKKVNKGQNFCRIKGQTYAKREKESLDIIELMDLFYMYTPKPSLDMYLIVEI